MVTYSYGTTPALAIKTAVDRECKGKPYTMELVGKVAQVVFEAVNQGIDAHLEACFCPDRGDSFAWSGSRLHCHVSAESMPVLLRRLSEFDNDTAMGLRTSILDTLEIEEI